MRGYLLRPTLVGEQPGVYEIDPSVLPAAQYNIRAKIEGTDPRGREVQQHSDVLTFVASTQGNPLPLEPEQQEMSIAKVLLAVASTFLWCWGLYRFFLQRRRDGVRNSLGLTQSIELEGEFYRGLSVLRDAPTLDRRAVRDSDRALFSLVADIYNEPHRFEEVLVRHRGTSPLPEEEAPGAGAGERHDSEPIPGAEDERSAAEDAGEKHS